MNSVSKTPLNLLSRLTQSEEAALATSTVPAVAIVRLRFACAERIVSTDSRIENAKNVLVSCGILTQARADEVFGFV